MTTLTMRDARRLALARGGLLKPSWTGLPSRARRRTPSARREALRILDRFGSLQLDTVSIAGARSHAIVLLSRLEGLDPGVAEELLQPGSPVFEYWGHEASWLHLDLYPALDFRRRHFVHHPWWGDVVSEHPRVAQGLRSRIRDEGPLRSIDMEGRGGRGWWDIKVAKRVATALWSSGEFAIRERRNFQRTFDLAERVIPEALRSAPQDLSTSLQTLLLRALEGHGWATTGTLAATWRLPNRRPEVQAALEELSSAGRIQPCVVQGPDERGMRAWIRPEDLPLIDRLSRTRPRSDRGVLLSPFDPVLWDRARVQKLFGFDQVLEIFKTAPQRVYGYYCLPVLAGERFVARFDLKAHRNRGTLEVLSARFEATGRSRPGNTQDGEAARTALHRYADALQLKLRGWTPKKP
jgi:uncharacterized protein YcaQ